MSEMHGILIRIVLTVWEKVLVRIWGSLYSKTRERMALGPGEESSLRKQPEIEGETEVIERMKNHAE